MKSQDFFFDMLRRVFNTSFIKTFLNIFAKKQGAIFGSLVQLVEWCRCAPCIDLGLCPKPHEGGARPPSTPAEREGRAFSPLSGLVCVLSSGNLHQATRRRVQLSRPKEALWILRSGHLLPVAS